MEPNFGRVQEDFFESLLELDPVLATSVGSRAHDHRLPFGGPEHEEHRVQLFERARDRLARLDSHALTPEERLDCEVVESEAARLRFLLEHGTYGLAGGDPAREFGEAVDALYCRETRTPRVRLEAIVDRVSAAPRFLCEARERFRRPVAYWTREAIRSCSGTASYLEEVLRGAPALLEGELGEPKRAALVAALRKRVRAAGEALGEFEGWLQTEVLPRSEHAIPMGREAFEELIRLRRLGFTVDELVELGRSAWEEFQREYRAELAGMFPGDPAGAMVRWGETAVRSFQELLETYRQAVAASRRFVVEELGLPIPEPERLEVVRTPDFLQTFIPSAAYYEPERLGAAELVGLYLVTPQLDGSDPVELTPGMIYNTSAHEGYPGHHLQLSWANRNPSLFRAVIGGDEFCEGWAHYCEEMMYDEGFRPVPGIRAAQLKDAMFRALRVRVDVALHVGTHTPEQAADLLVEEGAVGRGRAEGEVSWYTTAPGYPLGYLTGKVLMKDLRKREASRLGSRFDPRAFETAILRGGTLPVWAHARRLELLDEA